jgi:hypothetical protein
VDGEVESLLGDWFLVVGEVESGFGDWLLAVSFWVLAFGFWRLGDRGFNARLSSIL